MVMIHKQIVCAPGLLCFHRSQLNEICKPHGICMMASFTIHLLAVLTFLGAAETGPQPEKAARKRRDTPLLTFLQAPQKIRYFVSRKQPANLTWVATHVCKMEIRCNGKKFQENKTEADGVRHRESLCKTRTMTQIINVSDFPEGVRNMTCHCKVWGTISERNETTIVEKAFLRRKFGKVDLDLVALPNTTVTLQCKPPGGSPRPNITWCKNGEPLFFRRGRRVRVNAKGDLVIKRLRTNDTGEYRCIAESIVARREGLVITLEVRGNVSIAGCNESQWPCAGQSTPGFNSSVNTSSSCDSHPPMLVFGTQTGLYQVDLHNTSKVTHITANKIVSLDFGSDPNQIYWSDKKSINRISLHNGVNEETPFRRDDVISVEGLVVDWLADKVYWTDAVQHAIYIGDLRNGRKVKLIEENPDFPRAIVLSHSESSIYWTYWGRNPKIEIARLDGTERRTLVNNGIKSPNGLALDESDKKLYWAGTDVHKNGIIEGISLDGLNRTVIFHSQGYHPFSLDVFGGFVYWSDLGKNAVLRINKSDGSGEEVIFADLNRPMGLKILHRCKERPGRGDSCDENNGDCEHLCLYLPFRGRKKCYCNQENGKTCGKEELQNQAISGESRDGPWGLITPLLIIILVLLTLVLFVVAVKKRSSCSRRPPGLRSVPSTTREDDRDDTDDGAVEELATEPTDLVRAGSQPNDELPELNAQVCNAEPSGACAASEISPVKLHGDVVVYVTKVEVQQSGGVTIVGDEAKIHHHYPPQS